MMRETTTARRRFLACGAAILLASCMTTAGRRDATDAVNREFKREYGQILVEYGTRRYPVRRTDAFAALHAALSRLGVRVESQEPEVGYLNVHSPAPQPLNDEEWRRAGESDLPEMRVLARPHIGPAAEFINFEPEGLIIAINATVLDAAGGAEVSLTTRMREVAPPRPGMPRREYPPPTGVRLALDKIRA